MLAEPQSPEEGSDTLIVKVYSWPSINTPGLMTRFLECFPVEVVTSFISRASPLWSSAPHVYCKMKWFNITGELCNFMGLFEMWVTFNDFSWLSQIRDFNLKKVFHKKINIQYIYIYIYISKKVHTESHIMVIINLRRWKYVYYELVLSIFLYIFFINIYGFN